MRFGLDLIDIRSPLQFFVFWWLIAKQRSFLSWMGNEICTTCFVGDPAVCFQLVVYRCWAFNASMTVDGIHCFIHTEISDLAPSIDDESLPLSDSCHAAVQEIH